MHSIVWEINKLWGPSFSKQYSQFEVDFRNSEKKSKNFLSFPENCIWSGCFKDSLLPRENTCYRESVSYQTVSRFHILPRQNFPNWFISKWSKNMTKLLPCRFEQCFRPFNMLTVHKISDTVLIRYLSNHSFCSLWLGK